MPEPIPYSKPSITKKEADYANDAVTNGWGEKCYQYINKFENNFASYLGVKHCLSTSSCTGAIHIGLKALGIDRDDEIIVADSNWIASISPITYLGAKPIFCDIDPESWCIDPKSAERTITNKTKAIMAVHLYGNLCDMDALKHLGQKYDLEVIEDSAEAIGSKYKGFKAGSLGKFGVFSFHGTKTITTGEGGVLVTNDSKLYERALRLSNHGRDKNQKRQFWPDEIGYKYKMTNVQAAIGCAQLERINELVSRKREIFEFYKENFKGIDVIQLNFDSEEKFTGAWMPTVVFDKKLGLKREFILKKFSEENIDARVFFWPLSSLSMFSKVNNVNAYNISSRAVNLPSFHDITKKQLRRVCNVVFKIIENSPNNI